MQALKRLIRQAEAPLYLSLSEPKFNEIVRPFVIEIRHGKMIFFDVLDLDAWVDQFKAANGRPARENNQWQKEPQVLERKAKSGTSKRLSSVSSFDKALEKRNSTKQKGISPNDRATAKSSCIWRTS